MMSLWVFSTYLYVLLNEGDESQSGGFGARLILKGMEQFLLAGLFINTLLYLVKMKGCCRRL